MGKKYCKIEKKWCKLLRHDICEACKTNVNNVVRCPRVQSIETIRFADILKQVDFETVFNKLCEYYKNQKNSKEGYRNVFYDLLSMTPRKHNLSDLFIEVKMIEEDGSSYPNVSGINVANPHDKKTYAIEFVPWKDWVSMFLTRETLDSIDYETIVGACLYEMTFCGFEETTIKETKESIINSFKKIKNMKKVKFKTVLVDENNQPISSELFDGCGDFYEGFARVRLNDKYNFINQEGEILSDQWFDNCNSFHEGFAWVELNDKYNFINQEGKLISNQWFDWCGGFHEGFAWIKLNDKWNFINQEGNFLSDQWFDDCGNFYNGFAKVRLNGKYNFINQDGEVISNHWFDKCDIFREGIAWVELNGKAHHINAIGELTEVK